MLDVEDDEGLQRIGLGCADVLLAVSDLSQRGAEFIQSRSIQTDGRGALTKTWMGGVSFELVHNLRG